MPKMGGRELAAGLRSIRCELKVIYLSGYTTDAILRHGSLESGVELLQKPFGLHGLAGKIREALRKTLGG